MVEEELQKVTKKKVDPRVYQTTASLHPEHPCVEEPRQSPWSKEEQTQLESALRKYPATCSNRWDEIAKDVPTRSKKECMLRFKEIALAVQNKKAPSDKN